MSDASLLDRLQTAEQHFEARRFAAVIETLEGLPDHGGPVGLGLYLAARGLELEAQGRPDDADVLMERSFAQGATMPSLLRELTRFFRRRDRRLLAHHAFLMHELMEPGAASSVHDVTERDRARYAPWVLRASPWADRMDLYEMAPYKSALVERLGPEAAALVLAGMRSSSSPHVAIRRPLVPLIDHAREQGLEYEELIGAGPAVSTAIPLYRRPADEPVERRTRALFSCILEDVVVPARSGILLTAGRALLDIQEDELVRRPVDLSIDPVVVAGGSDEVLIIEPAERDELRTLPEAIWLTGVHTPAYGHWIMEFLPKLWALLERPGFAEVPILIDDRMPAQHVEAIRLFAGDANPLIVLQDQESARVRRLWVCSALVYLPVGPLPSGGRKRVRNGVDDEGFRRLLERIRPVLEAIDTQAAPRHVYLARKPSQHRRLVNAEAIQEQLEGQGFQKVDFGELAFREQLRIIRGAEQVVAAGGSALLTTVFGPPGQRIGVMMPPFYGDIGWLTQACRALGHELSVLVGELANEHPRYRWMSD
ncbi:hypothetical protein BH23CHL8_BH23CHL8_09900 [soil metagenome]